MEPQLKPRKPAWWSKLLKRSGIGMASFAVVGLGCRALWFSGPYRTPEAMPPPPIIDMHCHTAGLGADGSGCFVSPAMASSFRFGIYLKAFGTSREELLEKGDRILVDRIAAQVAGSTNVTAAVVLALDGVAGPDGELDRSRTEVYVPNEHVAAAVKGHASLRFGASINPRRKDAIGRLDRAVADGAVLVKWIPSIMDIDPSDPALEPFYRRLIHHRIPLLSHAGKERSFTFAKDELADPERLRFPLSLGVTVIAGHVAAGGENGGEADFERLLRLMREYPNLYTDISALTQANRLGWLRRALDTPEMEDRLVYGSDFPLVNTALVSPWYFPMNLTRAEMSRLGALTNTWDQDVALKQALGVPQHVFRRTSQVLRR